VKRQVSAYQQIFSVEGTTVGNYFQFAIENDDKIAVRGASNTTYLGTTQVLRDPSAWYHVLLAVDTTQSTPSNTLKLFLNGSQITTFDTSTYPSQNTDLNVNTTNLHWIGRAQYSGFGASHSDCYLTNIHLIDGQALTPSSFTETDATTGQLIPKTYTGSYGTNGFNLLFADNSSNTASTLGKDTSGLGNNWTPNNFSVVSGTGVVTVPTTNAPPTVDYLVVAGGGGGGGNDATASRASGGGGAGGFRNANGFSVTSGTQYTVTVGAAGAGAAGDAGSAGGSNGTNGGNSVFGSITSTGGGGGAGARGGTGSNGGSGGGAGDNGGTAGLGNSPATSPSQGNDGGPSGSSGIAGGGGGASTAGTTAAGGTGTASSISGSSVTYATGGQPGQSSPAAGTANRGNGGGGNFGSSTSGYSGGSGIVILRYANTYDDLIVGSGLTYTYANTGGYKIYSFTASATAAQSAGNDSLVDSPTNYGTDTGVGGEVRGNYCVINPLSIPLNTITISNGNLDLTATGTNQSKLGTMVLPSSGKWYWEISCQSGGSGVWLLGIGNSDENNNTSGRLLYVSDARKYDNVSFSGYGSTYTVGDVIGVAVDMDAATLTFYKNGVSQGVAFSSITTTLTKGIVPQFQLELSGRSMSFNAGQRAFAYPLSGFKSLCTQNLPTPLVTKPNTLMDVALYTGNNSSLTISGFNLSPDFIWFKARSYAGSHALVDIVRGASNQLNSNLTNAESTNTAGAGLQSFNSDGFTLGTESSATGSTNGTQTYAAWMWDAGTSTVSNTQGSITSQVRANATAGFSVVSYTGNGSAGATIGHGLNIKPVFFIVKSRGSSTFGDWSIYSSVFGATKALFLNLTQAVITTANHWNNTEPTASVFSVGTDTTVNQNGINYISYAWTSVPGYSSFGSYTGNGSADGPFVYTGFRSRWVLLKETSGVGNWLLWDSTRETSNVTNDVLAPNSSSAEFFDDPSLSLDITANGFKIRSTSDDYNGNGNGYIYAAFAEAPFNYSRAR
jgi:hypothetical protein